MLGSIKYNLASLTKFAGRDARQTFWYYVLFLVILQVIGSMAISLPMMADVTSGALGGTLGGASRAETDMMVVARIGQWFETTVWLGLAMGLVIMALLAAAFVRRLHDSDRSGWWAALAGAAQLTSAAISVSQIDKLRDLMTQSMTSENPEDFMAMQGGMLGASLVGYIPIIIVIVFGVMKSTDGPNRFGAEPVFF